MNEGLARVLQRFKPVLVRRILTALLVGLAAGLTSALILTRLRLGAEDFTWTLQAARDLLNGQDVYGHPVGPEAIPYPLPASFFGLPFLPFPPEIAAGLFFGISSSALAWFLLRDGQYWRLTIFLSWPFIYALIYAQWSPLVSCMYFTSSFLALLWVKPNIALPLALTRRPNRLGLLLAGLIGGISLILHPTWPWIWLQQIKTYEGLVPPLLVLPLGPLLLIALKRWRERRAWVLILMAIMPQRMLYDQLALLLTAENRKALLIMAMCSWLTLPALLIWGGWSFLPGGWQNWIVLTLYLPALVILLLPTFSPEERRASHFKNAQADE